MSGKALQIAEKRREAKGKGKKQKIYPPEYRVPKGRKKDFPSKLCKKIEETIEWERLEISSRKLKIKGEHFMQTWAH